MGGARGGADRRGRELRAARPWGELWAAPTVEGGSSGWRGHGGAQGGAGEGEGATAKTGEVRTQGAAGGEGPGRGQRRGAERSARRGERRRRPKAREARHDLLLDLQCKTSFWSFSLVREATPFGGASCFWRFLQPQKLGTAPPNRAIHYVQIHTTYNVSRKAKTSYNLEWREFLSSIRLCFKPYLMVLLVIILHKEVARL